MKYIQKTLLFVSLLSIDISVASFSSPILVDAATESSSKKNEFPKDLKTDKIYYKVGKNKFIKATDIKLDNNNTEGPSGSHMTYTSESIMDQDFTIEITSSKAHFYNKEGQKLHKVEQGTVYSMGDQYSFGKHSYYQISEDKLVALDDGL
ncbi:SLAP domain-containing protein [Companilactobacillus nuruki]|uniref:S-layer protein C-terminal domain-containing protein n=1 Tax=Companilactobacillus nuruki TaxID=1993540 RepID=A0A2N7ATE7_9LACO|nr:SLAP domain-containing protein [Companilactobacillus nuruki]PMD69166.1 hypothetical protein CBP76_08285 [Companilactobacillus nuruki]